MQELRPIEININEITATHEAAHAVVAYIFRRATRRASIGQDGEGRVRTMTLCPDARRLMSDERFRELAIEEVKIAMAGPCAEQILTGTVDATACAVDHQNSRRWLRELNRADDLSRTAFWFSTRRLLRERPTWAAVRAIAARLQRDGSLSGAELTEICRSFQVPRVAGVHR